MVLNFNSEEIAVICGGNSKEREISLKTGFAVFQALKRKNLNVILHEIASFDEQEIFSKNFSFAFMYQQNWLSHVNPFHYIFSLDCALLVKSSRSLQFVNCLPTINCNPSSTQTINSSNHKVMLFRF